MQVILLHLILSIFERWGVLEVCHAGFITQTLHRDFRRPQRLFLWLLLQLRILCRTAAILFGFARLMPAMGAQPTDKSRAAVAGLITAGTWRLFLVLRRGRLLLLLAVFE